MNDIWKFLIVLLIGIMVGLAINSECSSKKQVKVEYIKQIDTIQVDKERIINHTKIKYIDRVDTCYVDIKGDTVIITEFPIDHKVYNDTIKTDSTESKIQIKYSGFNPSIDHIDFLHQYYNKVTTIKEKKLHPFVSASVGPRMAPRFDECVGFSVEAQGGVIFKSNWGVIGGYELDWVGKGINHEVKVGFIRLF